MGWPGAAKISPRRAEPAKPISFAKRRYREWSSTSMLVTPLDNAMISSAVIPVTRSLIRSMDGRRKEGFWMA